MKKRVFTLLLAAGLLAVAAFSALTFPAVAQTQTVYVQLATGEVVPVQVDVPPGSTLDDIQLPGTPVPAPSPPETTTPTTPSVPKPPPTTAPARAVARQRRRQRPDLRRRLAAGAHELRRACPGQHGQPQHPRRKGSSKA